MPPRQQFQAFKDDFFLKLSQNNILRPWLSKFGLPTPVLLDRGTRNHFAVPPLAGCSVAVIGKQSGDSSHAHQTIKILTQLMSTKLGASVECQENCNKVLVDATWVRSPLDVSSLALHSLRYLAARKLKHGRIVILSSYTPSDILSASLSSGLASLVRSLAKEMGGTGTTVNMVVVRVAPFTLSSQTFASIAWPLAFLLLHESAFISGQKITVELGAGSSGDFCAWLESLTGAANNDTSRTLSPAAEGKLLIGKTCLVTGCSRGIGAAIATRLAAEGARVLGVDVPGACQRLTALMEEVGGTAFSQDLAEEGAERRLRDFVLAETPAGKLDCLIHNAGVTRDRTLRRMTAEEFEQVVKVNLEAVLRINEAFGLPSHTEGGTKSQLGPVLLNPLGRIVLLSSINGIAGAFGQTNYSFTKAALSGYAHALATVLSTRGPPGITINAIAPGFIETDMTRRMPTLGKFLGRRANALSQGGYPEDIAAATAFLCCEGSGGVSGQTLRVCGLNAVGK